MEHAPPACILCGKSARELLYRQEPWDVHRCAACGLAFLDPRPGREELKELYRRSYFTDQYDGGLKMGSREMKQRLSQEQHRLRFFRKFRKRGRLLDIGCGMGYFMLAARNGGYDVEGFDISDDSAAYARDELQITVNTGDIDSTDYAESSFDIITMWHFLEHTPDPRRYLEKAGHWLKEGGILVVDVPNYVSTDAQKTWQHWKGWQLPYHFYHFTPQTLRRLLSSHGFITVRTKSYLSEHVKETLDRLFVIKPFSRLIARCFSGHSFAVAARNKQKPGAARSS